MIPHGIRVNCIAPGPFPSEIIDFTSPAIVKIIENIPLKRAGKDTVNTNTWQIELMLGRCWSGVAVDERGGELYCREGIKSVPEFADIDNLRRRRTIAPRSWIVYETAKLNAGFILYSSNVIYQVLELQVLGRIEISSHGGTIHTSK